MRRDSLKKIMRIIRAAERQKASGIFIKEPDGKYVDTSGNEVSREFIDKTPRKMILIRPSSDT